MGTSPTELQVSRSNFEQRINERELEGKEMWEYAYGLLQMQSKILVEVSEVTQLWCRQAENHVIFCVSNLLR
jgi:hypothetical protein